MNAETLILNRRRAAASYLSLPGVSGAYASTPDSAALSITGDIDIRCRVAPANWTTQGKLVCKEQSSTTSSYQFGIFTGGKLRLQWSTDGTNFPLQDSTVVAGFSAAQVKWVRATLRVSDGRVQFFSSDDGVTWTQIGTDLASGATSIFDSGSPVEIGSQRLGTANRLTGKVYYAEIRNGIDGAMVFSCDFTQIPPGTTSFTCSTGQTITINGTASIAA